MPSGQNMPALDTDTRDAPCPREQLDVRFRGPLMAFFLRRTRERAEAEDLAQETLLRVASAASLDGQAPIDSYVFKVAINLLRDRRRKAVRNGNPVFVPIENSLAAELEAQLVDELSPERVAQGHDALNDAMRILDDLGERTRNIFLLYRLENMKQKDIAALYGIGQSTVEKHVMKAMMHLAKKLDGA